MTHELTITIPFQELQELLVKHAMTKTVFGTPLEGRQFVVSALSQEKGCVLTISSKDGEVVELRGVCAVPGCSGGCAPILPGTKLSPMMWSSHCVRCNGLIRNHTKYSTRFSHCYEDCEGTCWYVHSNLLSNPSLSL